MDRYPGMMAELTQTAWRTCCLANNDSKHWTPTSRLCGEELVTNCASTCKNSCKCRCNTSHCCSALTIMSSRATGRQRINKLADLRSTVSICAAFNWVKSSWALRHLVRCVNQTNWQGGNELHTWAAGDMGGHDRTDSSSKTTVYVLHDLSTHPHQPTPNAVSLTIDSPVNASAIHTRRHCWISLFETVFNKPINNCTKVFPSDNRTDSMRARGWRSTFLIKPSCSSVIKFARWYAWLSFSWPNTKKMSCPYRLPTSQGTFLFRILVEFSSTYGLATSVTDMVFRNNGIW